MTARPTRIRIEHWLGDQAIYLGAQPSCFRRALDDPRWHAVALAVFVIACLVIAQVFGGRG